jgi:hypothetical protein
MAEDTGSSAFECVKAMDGRRHGDPVRKIALIPCRPWMAEDTGSSAFELRDSDCVAQFPLLL